MPKDVKNLTLQTAAEVNAARAQAVERIEQRMMAGATALCKARTVGDEYWVTHEVDVSTTPRISLIWRSQSQKDNHPSVQVVLDAEVGPEELVRAAQVAEDETTKLLRESAAKIEGARSLAASLVAAYARVTPSTTT